MYTTLEVSKAETGGGEGVEILKNEAFDNVPLFGGKYDKGQYTYKVYHVQSRFPTWARRFVPSGLTAHEESWNAYPYSKTVVSSPYMDNKFFIEIESFHCEGRGDKENVLQLDHEKLKDRTVIQIDIANDPIAEKDYEEEEDPSKYKSIKSGQGPLTGDWKSSAEPLMTAYKLVSINFEWFGIQNRVEQFVQNQEQRLFTIFHRKLFCWTDKWYGLTLDEIRKLEIESKEELDEKRAKGEIKGHAALE